MTLELDNEQVDVMREILEAQQAQLLAEHARGDTAELEHVVLHRLEVVEHLLAQLPKDYVAFA
jgi:hypothetical protein